MARERSAEIVAVANGPKCPEFARRFDEIVRETGSKDVAVSFCGPKGLLERVRQLMRVHGVPQSNLRYEYFEFR